MRREGPIITVPGVVIARRREPAAGRGAFTSTGGGESAEAETLIPDTLGPQSPLAVIAMTVPARLVAKTFKGAEPTQTREKDSIRSDGAKPNTEIAQFLTSLSRQVAFIRRA